MNQAALFTTLDALFGEAQWPKPFHVLQGVHLCAQGQTPKEAARTVKTTAAAITRALEAPDPVAEVLGMGLRQLSHDARGKAALILGQLLLGACAEHAFENIYRAEMHTHELDLEDLREGRTDTDYRLYNGQHRPVYRINIKFFGGQFRRAQEMVGLPPEDCFALATYKIHSALKKQEEDQLPYIFAIVGVRDLPGERVGQRIPTPLIETVALVHEAPKASQKRTFEDAVVNHLVNTQHPLFTETLGLIEQADWHILSARRAHNLLRDLLFERVFALRIRNFARVFGRAELDMHFSLSQDLTPLRKYLRVLREGGSQRVTTLLERGEF